MRTFSAYIPIRLESVSNKREHWGARNRRAKAHRAAAVVIPKGLPLPAVVTITRIAPRELDTDNLAISAKALRDGIADRLGVDDRSKLVKWQYMQAKGNPKEYAAQVTIECR